jgi:hypothetical protein
MRKLGTVALVAGMTLAMATGSWAQVGRDSTKGGAAAGTGSTDTMNQKDGSMGQKGNSMQNGNMQKGSSGSMSK